MLGGACIDDGDKGCCSFFSHKDKDTPMLQMLRHWRPPRGADDGVEDAPFFSSFDTYNTRINRSAAAPVGSVSSTHAAGLFTCLLVGSPGGHVRKKPNSSWRSKGRCAEACSRLSRRDGRRRRR